MIWNRLKSKHLPAESSNKPKEGKFTLFFIRPFLGDSLGALCVGCYVFIGEEVVEVRDTERRDHYITIKLSDVETVLWTDIEIPEEL